MLKRYPWLVILFALMGCTSISFEPVTHPDQRIQFGGFSFLLPNGNNWEVNTDPIKYYRYWSTWWRSTVKVKIFKKNIIGPNHASGETEKLKVSVIIYEFGIMKFNHNDDLMEFTQEGYNSLDQKGIGLLESNFSIETIKEMSCVRSKAKAEGGREISDSEALAITRYMQGFICVHPRNPNHLIELAADQSVLKGHTPTDIQNELDYFFNTLEVEGS